MLKYNTLLAIRGAKTSSYLGNAGLSDLSAAFPIVEQQDRICPTGNTVVFALTAHASLKQDAVC